MRFWRWLEGALRPSRSPEGPDHVIAPSDLFSTQPDAIAALLPEVQRWQWATFEAPSAPDVVCVQVAGQEINTCTELVDLPGIACSIGMPHLSERIRLANEHRTDRSIHDVPNASTDEMAALVDGIFRIHF